MTSEYCDVCGGAIYITIPARACGCENREHVIAFDTLAICPVCKIVVYNVDIEDEKCLTCGLADNPANLGDNR